MHNSNARAPCSQFWTRLASYVFWPPCLRLDTVVAAVFQIAKALLAAYVSLYVGELMAEQLSKVFMDRWLVGPLFLLAYQMANTWRCAIGGLAARCLADWLHWPFEQLYLKGPNLGGWVGFWSGLEPTTICSQLTGLSAMHYFVDGAHECEKLLDKRVTSLVLCAALIVGGYLLITTINARIHWWAADSSSLACRLEALAHAPPPPLKKERRHHVQKLSTTCVPA